MRMCIKDGDFCENSSYLQGILSLVAYAVKQVKVHCPFFSTDALPTAADWQCL